MNFVRLRAEMIWDCRSLRLYCYYKTYYS